MGYRAPSTPKTSPTPDPLINLGETNADLMNQKDKRGLLASFLQGTRNRGSGFLSKGAYMGNFVNRQPTLGNSGV